MTEYVFKAHHSRNQEIIDWLALRNAKNKFRASLYGRSLLILYDLDEAVKFRLQFDIKGKVK